MRQANAVHDSDRVLLGHPEGQAYESLERVAIWLSVCFSTLCVPFSWMCISELSILSYVHVCGLCCLCVASLCDVCSGTLEMDVYV